jgi:hypothetical protein
MEIVMNHLKDVITQTGDSKHFTVKTITIHPDFIAQLGTNFTYQVQDDYISPEVPVEIEEEERVPNQEQEDVFNEVMEEIIHEIVESIELYPSSAEIIETEPESNNHQITQTNESNDLDWF